MTVKRVVFKTDYRRVTYDEETGKVYDETVLDKESLFIKDDNREELIRVDYLYQNGEGELTYDYCESCGRPVKQEDLGEGVYGCEYCKSPNQISVNQLNQ